MTSEATSRSDTARETISRLDGVRRQRTMATAAQTSELPSTVPTMMKMNTLRISTDRHNGPPPPSSPDDVVIVTSSDVQLVVMTPVTLETTTPHTASHAKQHTMSIAVYDTN